MGKIILMSRHLMKTLPFKARLCLEHQKAQNKPRPLSRGVRKGFLILLMMIFMSVNVFALGITPGRTTFDYAPGSESKVEFKIINSGNKDIELVVLVEGELNQSIAVSEVSFSMAVGESKTYHRASRLGSRQRRTPAKSSRGIGNSP